jgi:hypothetical protein
MKAKNKSKAKSGKKQQKKKIIAATVAVSAAGILGYFGWQYLKKRKEGTNTSDIDAVLKTINNASNYEASPAYNSPKLKATVSSSATIPATISTTDFPLQRGSKGNNVRLMQEALIAKYGKSILPKYGADGDFGAETANALKKAGFPATINESTLNVITQAVKVDSSSLGKDLYSSTVAKNYSKVLSLLKKIRSVEDYTSVNEVFKQNRINGVRQTIVNGLLNTFTTDTQKQQIKFEFLRIGLQFDGNKWSLSGFDGKSIVTTKNTTVWINATEGVKVPARMVLGNEVSRRLDYTLFENNGKYFLVTSSTVTYLNS